MDSCTLTQSTPHILINSIHLCHENEFTLKDCFVRVFKNFQVPDFVLCQLEVYKDVVNKGREPCCQTEVNIVVRDFGEGEKCKYFSQWPSKNGMNIYISTTSLLKKKDFWTSFLHEWIVSLIYLFLLSFFVFLFTHPVLIVYMKLPFSWYLIFLLCADLVVCFPQQANIPHLYRHFPWHWCVRYLYVQLGQLEGTD